MGLSGDYPSNPPSLWRDVFKINLIKTVKKKYGSEMRRAFARFPDHLPLGSPAPDFTLETPSGERVSLADLRGRVGVLEFGAIT